MWHPVVVSMLPRSQPHCNVVCFEGLESTVSYRELWYVHSYYVCQTLPLLTYAVQLKERELANPEPVMVEGHECSPS